MNKPSLALVALLLTGCFERFSKPDDSGVESPPVDSPVDSLPEDSPVDTVTGATGETADTGTRDTGETDEPGDTGDPALPQGELLVLEEALALFVGHAGMVECGRVLSGAGDLDVDGYADLIFGSPDADWDNSGGGATLIVSGVSAAGELDLLLDHDLRLEALGYNEGSGAAVTRAGDIDGDGIDDIAMAAESAWYNGYDREEGQVHLWWGDPGLLGMELETSSSDARFDMGSFGYPVLDGGGDVDGDGLNDLVAGMSDHDAHPGGVAWIVSGPALSLWGKAAGDSDDACGVSVALLPDVDGDGYDDVLIGAPAWVDGADSGYAGLVQGGASPVGAFALGAAWLRIVSHDSQHEAVGYAVAGLGDVLGEGQGAFAVASTLREGETWVGEEAALFVGSSLPAGGTLGLEEAHATFTVEQRGPTRAMLGLAGPGDVDGDGRGDWLIGAGGYLADDGSAFLFLGAGLDAGGALGPGDANVILGGGSAGAFGWSVALPGDVDGDGLGEVLVGGPMYEPAGAAALFSLAGALGPP